ncbi:hypothetical protein [Tranquillimonas alkanivorans]|uniref:Uncharacterized protein n=1 Tax=Tranquillimonas alkanivorans TaxID=441119 RepID=A0A1I5SPL0_9RHOB|nr:hypothetical protein [Tranquillimonas alkanivorans]SFP72236.1 hypothetical protein SAMN04488047_111108 [Tranquillimonas alkanivorans]
MKRTSLIALVMLTSAAGCDVPDPNAPPEPIDDISPAAMAALPEGVDPIFLIRDAQGCYGISVEATEPVTGVALLDAEGNQVCDT